MVRKFVSQKWLKTEIKMKLNLIYYSKCKIYTKWWKIKMKTCNLTQSSLRNDPINHRMHGFSFRVFKDEIEVQDVISPLSFDQTLISSSPWMWKRVKNTRNQTAHESGVWTVRIFLKIHGRLFPSRRTVFKEVKRGVTVRWRDASRSTVANTRPLANRCF